MIYLIGSLRNPKVPEIAKRLRQEGIEVFAEWFAAGPEADDYWKAYEQSQGYSYIEALSRPAAKNVFAFDRTNLDRSSTVVLVLPAGRSGHLELGYGIGSGKPGYILLDDPDRWDVMYQFATGIYADLDILVKELKKNESSTDQLPKERPQNIRVCPACNGSIFGSCHACSVRSPGNLRGNRPLNWSTEQILKALRSK